MFLPIWCEHMAGMLVFVAVILERVFIKVFKNFNQCSNGVSSPAVVKIKY